MAFRDSWHRALVYFGLAEDRDEYPDEEPEALEPENHIEDHYRERPNVRRLSGARRRRDEIDDIFADDEPSGHRTGVLRPVGGSGARNGRSQDVRGDPLVAQAVNNAQGNAPKFKESIPPLPHPPG